MLVIVVDQCLKFLDAIEKVIYLTQEQPLFLPKSLVLILKVIDATLKLWDLPCSILVILLHIVKLTL